MQRRVVTILAMDVVGYAGLVEADETATLARLKALHNDIIAPAVSAGQGRIFKLTGDGMLAEFPSAVNALNVAIAIQQALAAQEGNAIRLRAGLNLGDVVADGGDLLGDGVNVAARLEALAEPGGVCLSGTVYDQLRGAAAEQLEPMGEVRVKNIARPIRAWRVRTNLPARARQSRDAPGPLPGFRLPKRAVLAVLPFDNLSGDAAQTAMADSLTEAIIADLSRSSDLAVIARNSVFAYRGQAINVKTLGAELKADFVLEGSLQTAGQRTRIVAQLVDTTDGHHLWANRYDYSGMDVFDLQDDLTEKLTIDVSEGLGLGTFAFFRGAYAFSFDDYLDMRRGRAAFMTFTVAGFNEAERLWRKLFDRAPDDPFSLLLLAWLEWTKAVTPGLSAEPREKHLDRGRAYAEQAKHSAGAETFDWHVLMAALELHSGDHAAALAHSDASMRMAPTEPFVVENAGYIKTYAGQAEEGCELLLRATRVARNYPLYVAAHLAIGLAMLKRYDEAIFVADQILEMPGQFAERGWLFPLRAALAVWTGAPDEARRFAERALQAVPRFDPFRFPGARPTDADRRFAARYVAAMAAAGLPVPPDAA